MIDEPFLIAYTDLAGLWPSLKPFLLPRLPIRGLQLLTLPGAPTKPARPLAARFIDSRDPLLSSDPQGRAFVFWSVQSFVHVILVTCEDLEDYKAKVKPRIEETLKSPLTRTLGEPLLVYVRPSHLDRESKGPKRVMERLYADWSSGLKSLAAGTQKCRICRIDPPYIPGSSAAPSGGHVRTMTTLPAQLDLESPMKFQGLETFDQGMRDCLRTRFETLISMLSDQARVLSESRNRPGWDFADLMRVRDNAARMLTAAGFPEDAEREYVLLERTYLEVVSPSAGFSSFSSASLTAPPAPQPFGGDTPGDDTATFLDPTFFDRRYRAAARLLCKEYEVRQYLFARQAELMRQGGRRDELLERALRFMQEFTQVMARKQAEGIPLRPHLRECWTVSACLALCTELPWLGKRGCRAAGEPVPLTSALGSSAPHLEALQPLMRLIVAGDASSLPRGVPRDPGCVGGGWSASDRWDLGLDELVDADFKELMDMDARDAHAFIAAAGPPPPPPPSSRGVPGPHTARQVRFEAEAARWRASLLACARSELVRLGKSMGYTRGMKTNPVHTDAARLSVINLRDKGAIQQSREAFNRPAPQPAVQRNGRGPTTEALGGRAVSMQNGTSSTDSLPLLSTPPRALTAAMGKSAQNASFSELPPASASASSGVSTPVKHAPNAPAPLQVNGAGTGGDLNVQSSSHSYPNLQAAPLESPVDSARPKKSVGFLDKISESFTNSGGGGGGGVKGAKPPQPSSVAKPAPQKPSSGHRRFQSLFGGFGKASMDLEAFDAAELAPTGPEGVGAAAAAVNKPGHVRDREYSTPSLPRRDFPRSNSIKSLAESSILEDDTAAASPDDNDGARAASADPTHNRRNSSLDLPVSSNPFSAAAVSPGAAPKRSPPPLRVDQSAAPALAEDAALHSPHMTIVHKAESTDGRLCLRDESGRSFTASEISTTAPLPLEPEPMTSTAAKRRQMFAMQRTVSSLGPRSDPIFGGLDLSVITEPRLKEALSNREKFLDFFLALSCASALAFGATGRRRNAAMLELDVASALVAEDRKGSAVALLRGKLTGLGAEGWAALQSQAGALLAECRDDVAPRDLAAACVSILSFHEQIDPQLATSALGTPPRAQGTPTTSDRHATPPNGLARRALAAAKDSPSTPPNHDFSFAQQLQSSGPLHGRRHHPPHAMTTTRNSVLLLAACSGGIDYREIQDALQGALLSAASEDEGDALAAADGLVDLSSVIGLAATEDRTGRVFELPQRDVPPDAPPLFQSSKRVETLSRTRGHPAPDLDAMLTARQEAEAAALKKKKKIVNPEAQTHLVFNAEGPGHGHVSRVRVGEAATLSILIFSRLPAPLPLTQATVTLRQFEGDEDLTAATNLSIAADGASDALLDTSSTAVAAAAAIAHRSMRPPMRALLGRHSGTLTLQPGLNHVQFNVYADCEGYFSIEELSAYVNGQRVFVTEAPPHVGEALKLSLPYGAIFRYPQLSLGPKPGSLAARRALLEGELRTKDVCLAVDPRESKVGVSLLTMHEGIVVGYRQPIAVAVTSFLEGLDSSILLRVEPTVPVITAEAGKPRATGSRGQAGSGRQAVGILSLELDGGVLRASSDVATGDFRLRNETMTRGLMKLPALPRGPADENDNPTTAAAAAPPSHVVWVWANAVHIQQLPDILPIQRLGSAPTVVSSGGFSGPSFEGRLSVDVEYGAKTGCVRLHSTELLVPVRRPFEIQAVATLVGDGRLCLHLQLVSHLPWTTTVTDWDVSLQPGFVLESELGYAHLPAVVPPGAALGIVLFLRPLRNRSAAPSTASLTALAERELAMAARRRGAAAAATGSASSRAGAAVSSLVVSYSGYHPPPRAAVPAASPGVTLKPYSDFPGGLAGVAPRQVEALRGMCSKILQAEGGKPPAAQGPAPHVPWRTLVDPGSATPSAFSTPRKEPGGGGGGFALTASQPATPATAGPTPASAARHTRRTSKVSVDWSSQDPAARGASVSAAGTHEFGWTFCLRAEGADDTVNLENAVRVKLLPSAAGRVGDPITFCWVVERPLGYTGEDPAETGGLPSFDFVQYEVAVDPSLWRPGGVRSGVLRLARDAGASCTLESSWLPKVSGKLPPPILTVTNMRVLQDFGPMAGADAEHATTIVR